MTLPTTPPRLLTPDGQVDNEELLAVARLLQTDLGKDQGDQYLHWDQLRLKTAPEGVTDSKQLWHLTKFRRRSAYRKLPFHSQSNGVFVYWLPAPVQYRLHLIDQIGRGNMHVDELVTNSGTKDRYLVNSLMREAISSSQLEGATTTYKVAKTMLRENRQPRDKDERMIFNNYRAMRFIRDVKDVPLNAELLVEIHKIITDGTLKDSNSEGRLRQQGEVVGVFDKRDGTKLHEGTPAESLTSRLQTIYQFANSTENTSGEFIHPVVKAIVLHFMVAYEHPFMDGNGRTARALFYWSMLRSGYWLIEFLSISSIIKEAPAQYSKAYLYTETDDNDVTYFLDFNTRVLLKALNELQQYIGKKSAEVERVHELLGDSELSERFNHRQIALISTAIRNSGGVYTIESHQNSHNITYPTARSDLKHLEELGLLSKRKVSNKFVYRPVLQLETLLRQLMTE